MDDLNHPDSSLWTSFWEDQRDAAQEHAKEILGKVSEEMDCGDTVKRTENFYDTYLGEHFGWMRSKEEFMEDPPSLCFHISLANPTVMYVPLADPKLLLCLSCALTTAAYVATKYPNTCDHCDRDDVIYFHEIMIQVGMMLVSGNICDDCYEANLASFE